MKSSTGKWCPKLTSLLCWHPILKGRFRRRGWVGTAVMWWMQLPESLEWYFETNVFFLLCNLPCSSHLRRLKYSNLISHHRIRYDQTLGGWKQTICEWLLEQTRLSVVCSLRTIDFMLVTKLVFQSLIISPLNLGHCSNICAISFAFDVSKFSIPLPVKLSHSLNWFM